MEIALTQTCRAGNYNNGPFDPKENFLTVLITYMSCPPGKMSKHNSSPIDHLCHESRRVLLL